MLHKRLSLLAVSILVLSGSAIVAARFISGQPNEQKPLTMKVMRGKYHLKNKPTSQEIEVFKTSQKEERQFEDSIPKHVPLKIKIKKEKEKGFKDLKNENWAGEFQLEVTNTGDKPIYEFDLLLVTDVKAAAGYRIVAPLRYGRPELADLSARPTNKDIPIQPGETYVLSIDTSQVLAWEYYRKKQNRSLPKKVQIKLQGISFGDGTGYIGNGGILLPRTISQNDPGCVEPRNRPGPFAMVWDSLASQNDFKLGSGDSGPAMIMPVNFLTANSRSATTNSTQGCCTEAGCTMMTRWSGNVCVNCPPQNRPGLTFCGDPAGACLRATYDTRECFIKPDIEPYLCQTIDLADCGSSAPTPTPTPTPTPSPSPSPTPIPCPFTDAGNCASGVPRDYCTNPNPPGIDTGGCPPFMHADGNCCVPDACPSPTPTPPPCEGGVLHFNEVPICNWQCLTLGGNVGGEPIYNGGYYCTPYFWVWYISFDGGETWWPTGQVEYAGCW